MSTTPSTAQGAKASTIVLPRWMLLFRAGVLLAAGLTITFSATMHETFGFDLVVVATSLVIIGLMHLVEGVLRRGTTGVTVPYLLWFVSLLAAAVMVFTSNQTAFALTISAWALVSALLEFIGLTVAQGSRQDGVIIGAIGMLLAVLVLLVRDDVVAVIGFFGAYAIIAGVFLGIAGFDPRKAGAEPAAEPAPQISPAVTQSESE